jgi:predicted ATPase
LASQALSVKTTGVDPTPLELMDLLVDRVPTLPVLVVVTFRPEFMSSWIGRPHVTSLSLSSLSPRHCIAVIAGITDRKALPKELADQITERSDGVPLFIEELTKAVLDSGALVDVGDRYMANRRCRRSPFRRRSRAHSWLGSTA